MPFSILLHFLPVLSLETSVCSILKFCPVSRVIMSISRSFYFQTFCTRRMLRSDEKTSLTFHVSQYLISFCLANFRNKLLLLQAVVRRNESDWSIFLVGSSGCLRLKL